MIITTAVLTNTASDKKKRSRIQLRLGQLYKVPILIFSGEVTDSCAAACVCLRIDHSIRMTLGIFLE